MLQNKLYSTLIKYNIPSITSRFIAYKLETENNQTIQEVKQLKPQTFLIKTEKYAYKVETHVLDIPDAKIIRL